MHDRSKPPAPPGLLPSVLSDSKGQIHRPRAWAQEAAAGGNGRGEPAHEGERDQKAPAKWESS
ncbi:MAG TPA: hypothetical protein VIC05_08240 [Solirubrobacteraceae bacterium]